MPGDDQVEGIVSDPLSQFRLDGRVAVVTGASKNIGLEISRLFGRAGAKVFMVARGRELLEARASELRADGSQIDIIAADISSEEGRKVVCERVHEVHSQADVLVNSAYGTNAKGIDPLEFDADIWSTVVGTNIVGTYGMIAGLGKRMRVGNGGSIINILSGSGFLPVPGNLPYGSTKAALWMMTRYLAVECAPAIRVNALVPGLVMSDSGGPKMSERIEKVFMPQIPMQRPGMPTEVAPAALYLASDASSYTTGTVLFVNGGRPW